jgi:hypothetical protein
MKTSEVLSVAQAAEKIGIREKTLRRRINRGTVEVDELIGKQVLTRDQVKALQKEEAKKRRKS